MSLMHRQINLCSIIAFILSVYEAGRGTSGIFLAFWEGALGPFGLGILSVFNNKLEKIVQ